MLLKGDTTSHPTAILTFPKNQNIFESCIFVHWSRDFFVQFMLICEKCFEVSFRNKIYRAGERGYKVGNNHLI